MKRTPLERRTPMPRATKPRARSSELRDAPLRSGSPAGRGRRRARLRASAPGGVQRMKHRRVPELRDWIGCQFCVGREWVAGHVCGYSVARKQVECAHVRTRGAGHGDLFNVVPMCPALHDATEAGKRHAWERRTGVDLVALARIYTSVWVARTGFDLAGYVAAIAQNPKWAAYAAELRAHLDPKEHAA